MFKSLSDNLNILMAENRINSNELSRLTGLPATTIKRIRNNEQSNPTISTLLPIANYFSISLDELMGLEALKKRVLKAEYGLNAIPLLSWRESVHFSSLDYSKLPKNILTERKVTEKAFALRAEDEELFFFPKNSLLIIEPKAKPQSGDYVIVAKPEQELASIKKYFIETGKAYLRSLVQGIGITPLTKDYMILGAVIQYKVEMRETINDIHDE